jgi:O-antigen ligase
MAVNEKKNWIIQILMIILVASFYIFEDSSFGSIILLGVTAAIFGVMAMEYKMKIPFKIEAFHIHILVFAAFCFASSLWAENAGYAVEKGITLIEILICMSVVYSYYSVKNNAVDQLLIALMWAGFVVVIYSYIYYGLDMISNVLLLGQRLDNGFTNINSVGMISGIMIIISIYKVIYDKKIVYLLFDIPGFILILATGSRKALVLTIMGSIMIFVLKNLSANFLKSAIKITAIAIVAFLLIRWMISLDVFSGIDERMQGLIALVTGKGTVDHSALVRLNYIHLGIDIFKKNPIFGIGMGNARIYAASVYGSDAYLHNNYVELLANGGIVGFIIYYSIYFDIVKKIVSKFRYRDKKLALIIVLLIMLLIMDYGMVSYYSKNTIFYFLIFFMYINELNGRCKYELETLYK